MMNISRMATAPLIVAQRVALIIQRQVPAPLWLSVVGFSGLLMFIPSIFLPMELKFPAMSLGLLMLASLVVTMIRSLSSPTALSRSSQATLSLNLMGHGITQPQQRLKQNPELTRVHAAVAEELGIDLSHTAKYDDEERPLYDAALLILSGEVAPNDSHLLVAAVKRGILTPDGILAEVADMKSHGYALAEGSL